MITTIKQYGEIRTGTNYLRALLLRNFPQTQVLSYILGGKHHPPADFGLLWTEAQASDDLAFTFVSTATYSQRGGASHPKDPTQQEELALRAPGIAEAYATDALGFLVSIKHPYAWVVSAARFNGWLHDDEQLREWNLELVRDACIGYNCNYRAWFALMQEYGSRARLVRYEELLADPARVLAEIAVQFGWQCPVVFKPVTAVVEPTSWDHLPVEEAKEPFCPDYYREAAFMNVLSPAHRHLIDDVIDWELLHELGYAR